MYFWHRTSHSQWIFCRFFFYFLLNKSFLIGVFIEILMLFWSNSCNKIACRMLFDSWQFLKWCHTTISIVEHTFDSFWLKACARFSYKATLRLMSIKSTYCCHPQINRIFTSNVIQSSLSNIQTKEEKNALYWCWSGFFSLYFFFSSCIGEMKRKRNSRLLAVVYYCHCIILTSWIPTKRQCILWMR